MKTTIITTLVVALLAIYVPTVSATPQDGESQGGLVAVLDVAKVFKANPSFERSMKAIQDEANTLKAQIQKKQEDIRARAQKVSNYEIGTPERNQQEAQLEQEQTALRTQARQSEADLLKREAQIYYDTYTEMQSTVGALATKHGITLVLRFDSEQIDPSNRGEVIKGVNRAVVFHHRLDLTNMVIRTLQPNAAAAPSGTSNK